MPAYEDALDSIVATIADYHTTPDRAHVARWIEQFPDAVQLPILQEVGHVLKKTYWSRAHIVRWLTSFAGHKNLTDDPATFWPGVHVLRLQNQGNSQRDMLAILDQILQQKYGLALADCGKNPHLFLYLDDFLFSGGRIKSDILTWIAQDAPPKAALKIVTIGSHAQGRWIIGNALTEAVKQSGKDIAISWGAGFAAEDRKRYMAKSDVLRPTAIPDDAATTVYVNQLGVAPTLRVPGNVGGLAFFSNDAGRQLIEREFLKMGVHVADLCTNMDIYMRPLGRIMHKSLGFGTMTVTYRNCPNNAPLVLWAGDPWYPLFARKTN